MKLHSFFALAAISFASLPLLPAFALAQGESQAFLEYVAPTPECMSNDAFQALVKAEITRFPSSDRNRRLSVRVVQQEGLFAGTLTTETGAVRMITAARCDDVTAALAVIVAVAEPPGAVPAAAPSPPADGHARADLSQPNELDRERQGSASGLEWRVGARGFATNHPSWGTPNPGVMGFASVEVPWGFHAMMFEGGIGASFANGSTPREFGPAGPPMVGLTVVPSSLTFVIVDTEACLLDVPIGESGLSVLGCLRVAGGTFNGSGGALYPSAGLMLWGGLSTRLRWQSPTRLFFEVNFDAMYGTISDAADNGPGWFEGGASLGVRL
jgi:hypothetical protein